MPYIPGLPGDIVMPFPGITGEIESTVNHAARRADHLKAILELKANKSSQMQLWAKDHGGLTSLYWASLYETLNFYLLFLNDYPGYFLNVQEVILLKALTEFLPRILECSILSNLDLLDRGTRSLTAWNKQTYVTFKYLVLSAPPIRKKKSPC